MSRPFEQAWKKARRVLLMIQELHRAGYERLRAFSVVADGPAPRWVCYVVPARWMSREHGAVPVTPYPRAVARPQDGPAPMPFSLHRLALADYPWPGFATDPPAGSARTFVALYPGLAGDGRGPDPAYADWYAGVLALTAPDGLFHVHAPGAEWPGPVGTIGTLRTRGDVAVPPPPPGEG